VSHEVQVGANNKLLRNASNLGWFSSIMKFISSK
jgi:hypothetical protein